MLLGAAACHRGSGDARVSKMLLLHVPAAHPDNFPDLELSPLVQASVGGVGCGSVEECGLCACAPHAHRCRQVWRAPSVKVSTSR